VKQIKLRLYDGKNRVIRVEALTLATRIVREEMDRHRSRWNGKVTLSHASIQPLLDATDELLARAADEPDITAKAPPLFEVENRAEDGPGTDIGKGDVVQISPAAEAWDGRFGVVLGFSSEKGKPCAKVEIQTGKAKAVQATIPLDDIRVVGRAHWLPAGLAKRAAS
jgi:hypothetical protein